MSRYSVKIRTGEVFGPVEEDVLVRWASEGRVPADALLVDESGVESPADAHERLRVILQAPPTRPGLIVTPEVGGTLSGIIPYRNPPALVGYYISVVSLIPGFALAFGPIAIILGIVGLRKHKTDPRVKGTAHAIVAIGLGSLTTLANGVVLGWLLLHA
jgi:hypothetical protein